MQAAIFRGVFNIQVEQIPDAAILEQTDAVVQITHACICGTDLWPYRGQGQYQSGWQIGHEWMGIVEDIGSEVRTIKRGDRVIASYDFCSDACLLPILAYAGDWPQLGPIFPDSLRTCLLVDSTPRRSWMRRSALPRWLPGTRRWISDRPLKSWFDRNRQRSRRRMRKEQEDSPRAGFGTAESRALAADIHVILVS